MAQAQADLGDRRGGPHRGGRGRGRDRQRVVGHAAHPGRARLRQHGQHAGGDGQQGRGLLGRGPGGRVHGLLGGQRGDTVIGLFSSHANAVAYADGMVILGLHLHTPTAEVVGPNWVVNTSPAFAGEVVAAIGGEIVTKANAQPGPAAAWPTDVIPGAAARG